MNTTPEVVRAWQMIEAEERTRQIIDEEIKQSKLGNTKKVLDDKANKHYPELALYYYYLHEAKTLTRFENHPKKKVGAIKEIAIEKNISWKAFQLEYNRILKKENRISKKNISYLKKVIPMLKDHSTALKLAEQDLKLCSLKN